LAIDDGDDVMMMKKVGNIKTHLQVGICDNASGEKTIWGSLDHSLLWQKGQ